MSGTVVKLDDKDNSFIQQTIWNLLKQHAFLGNFIQELTIRMSTDVPTAALAYDKRLAQFEILLNVEFMRKQTVEARVGILLHELMHFTNGHIFRFQKMGDQKQQMLYNIAADMAINQYISHLPEGCVNVAEFKMKDGSPFPTFKTMEVYFELLKETTKKPDNEDGEGNGEGDQEGEGKGGSGSPGKGKGNPYTGESINYPKIKNYKEFDPHEWGDLTDEEKQQMLQESKQLVKRTVEKTFKDYSMAPQGVKDLLDVIETQIRKMNYKGLLRAAIRKTVTSNSRQNTWNKPSKRFGAFAPGTTVARMPALNMYMDFSGSISVTEANQFLKVINGFLSAGDYKKCGIGFWHTELYRFRPYKAKSDLQPEDIQSGGTDPMCVINHIRETNPDLSIILTDGHYGKEQFKLSNKIIWVISEGGNMQHPYADLGVTIGMSGLK